MHTAGSFLFFFLRDRRCLGSCSCPPRPIHASGAQAMSAICLRNSCSGSLSHNSLSLPLSAVRSPANCGKGRCRLRDSPSCTRAEHGRYRPPAERCMSPQPVPPACQLPRACRRTNHARPCARLTPARSVWHQCLCLSPSFTGVSIKLSLAFCPSGSQ